MGKIEKILTEQLINSVPERNGNLLRIYRAPNQEVTIHYRNLKIVLHTQEEIQEWKDGFAQALKKLNEISSH
ncbi:MAG: hypothetical protein [Siphoviridae sp. cttb18]|nr:MAG: hypothetical protein [Siphoviridae sp. cttb18]